LVTGSGVSYYTSSCAQSGGIFLDDWKVAPHIFYDVTASLNFRPENDCTASTYSDLGYTVNSYDQTTGRWYSANEYGMPNTSSAYATLVGASTAVKTNIVSGDCRFNAIQFSGSMQLTTSVEPETREVYIAIVSGSFKLSGNNGNSPFQPWNFITAHDGNTGTIIINNDSTFVGQTTKNSLVGLGIGAYFPSSQKTALFLTVSGSSVAGNPPVLNGGPWNFGSNFTLEGEGIIRGFSVVTDGTVALQSQYNCIYETTPSK
jgi:hypothetical protein